MIEQCKDLPEVVFMKSPFTAPGLDALYKGTTFSIQPPGDSNTRRAIWDALRAGNIPVIFHPNSFNPFTFPMDKANGTILLHLPTLGSNLSALVDFVQHLPSKRIEQMQQNIAYSKRFLFYADADCASSEDAITSMLQLLQATPLTGVQSSHTLELIR